ncbi:MAG TPA: sigma factor-like helix-turn-helix DNA-binding protein [Candidatus Paceibacterota bacterium]|nr:sigma factor-like helix-turn-helix DNA-binding protein [Candidatus Paceibacterota bacterium]
MTLKEMLYGLVDLLAKRQKDIIIQRFGFDKGKPKTLAALGGKYGVTRERIRQIEAAALKSISKTVSQHKEIKNLYEKALAHIENLGGVRRSDMLVEDLKFVFKDNNLDVSTIELLFSIFKKPLFFAENKEFFSFWYTSTEKLKENKEFINKVAKILKSKKEEIIERKKFDELFYQVVKSHSVPESIAANFTLNSKRFAVSPFGDFGLTEWPEIVPKTVRDKSYLVLKKQNKPLHFREIAQEINKIKFDQKKAHPQTVHNELIKDQRFVLVGRGLYGLKENGYQTGTAREVLKRILKNNGPKSFDQIVQLVSQQRVLKNNTILLNLQDKKHFKKLEGGMYHVA